MKKYTVCFYHAGKIISLEEFCTQKEACQRFNSVVARGGWELSVTLHENRKQGQGYVYTILRQK